jgi:hypothetical protein
MQEQSHCIMVPKGYLIMSRRQTKRKNAGQKAKQKLAFSDLSDFFVRSLKSRRLLVSEHKALFEESIAF